MGGRFQSTSRGMSVTTELIVGRCRIEDNRQTGCGKCDGCNERSDPKFWERRTQSIDYVSGLLEKDGETPWQSRVSATNIRDKREALLGAQTALNRLIRSRVITPKK